MKMKILRSFMAIPSKGTNSSRPKFALEEFLSMVEFDLSILLKLIIKRKILIKG